MNEKRLEEGLAGMAGISGTPFKFGYSNLLEGQTGHL